VSPAQEGCGKILAYKALGEEKLDEGAAEGFGELLGVMERQEEESPVGGEPSFQHQRVPVGVRTQEIAEGLKCDYACRAQQGGSRGQAIELPDHGEEERGDGREKFLVVTEEDSQGLGD
jgi:hypothetical protein